MYVHFVIWDFLTALCTLFVQEDLNPFVLKSF